MAKSEEVSFSSTFYSDSTYMLEGEKDVSSPTMTTASLLDAPTPGPPKDASPPSPTTTSALLHPSSDSTKSSRGLPHELNNNVLTPNGRDTWKCAAHYLKGLGEEDIRGQFSPLNPRRLPLTPIYRSVSESMAKLTLESDSEDFLFPPSKLKSVDFSTAKNVYPEGISHLKAGKGLNLRPLHVKDFSKGYLQLMAQLTTVGAVSFAQFKETFHEWKRTGCYYVIVIEDEERGRIVGSATLVLERKMIHSAGRRGRVEDVVVSGEYRGKQLGKILVETLTILGREVGCYKMSLECKDKLIPFYESFGYTVDQGNNFLVQRFKE